MIQDYLDWFVSFISDSISQLNSLYIVDGVTVLGFIGGCALMCVIVGRILIR